MSTFDGFIKEFPDIQVDYFRSTAQTARRRPLACFLSHVHSDHLVGLDTLRSPFVYCSAATRALVLQLEKYPCRINFAKGILEARRRTYKDVKYLLKPLPLDTPTAIELSPGNGIQVTLLDANHCPGSVMFLFENEQTAALYTGDTRLEPWFVNSLVRNPSLAEYVSGLRTLDTVYMDTTFLQKDVAFQTKSEGLCELLQAVAKYPPDTVFYFRAWTFGYEEVWTALSKVLKSKVHVDDYKMSMYASLISKVSSNRFGAQYHLDAAAPGLVGFMCANTEHRGCLQTEDELVRLHSCEKATDYCDSVRTSSVVWIRPIVCRYPRGQGEMAEMGAGGGGEDLNKEAELEISSQHKIDQLCQLLSKKSESVNEDDKDTLRKFLHGRRIPMHLDVGESQVTGDGHDQVGAKKIEDAFRDMVNSHGDATGEGDTYGKAESLPRSITFPYSRHSSYEEQCDLLEKLRPRDVWPCTVNKDTWFRNGNVFRHDEEVASKYSEQDPTLYEVDDCQMSELTVSSDLQCSDMPPQEIQFEMIVDGVDAINEQLPALPSIGHQRSVSSYLDLPYFYHYPSAEHADYHPKQVEEDHNGQVSQVSQVSQASARDFARERRILSHQAVVSNAVGGNDWAHIALSSTSDNHTTPDPDLGDG
ncbi:artemis protein [Ophiostoma piceae UAMH 11346]|uniref:Artemis protein n=1 Tax=Ophiostoma piceae (strain UAMH 11346) TaxID=1262450 RepID=S3CUU8_OPHP1|nr:artemis protein [Ophiostoma piceae UAMH 11346]